jgi:hypothetical protein
MDGWYFSKVDMLIVNPIINIEGVKVRVGEKRYSFFGCYNEQRRRRSGRRRRMEVNTV